MARAHPAASGRRGRGWRRGPPPRAARRARRRPRRRRPARARRAGRQPPCHAERGHGGGRPRGAPARVAAAARAGSSEDAEGRRLHHHLADRRARMGRRRARSGRALPRRAPGLDARLERRARAPSSTRSSAPSWRPAAPQRTEARRARRTNRRLRTLLAGVAALLVLAAVAGALFLDQRGQARGEARTAAGAAPRRPGAGRGRPRPLAAAGAPGRGARGLAADAQQPARRAHAQPGRHRRRAQRRQPADSSWPCVPTAARWSSATTTATSCSSTRSRAAGSVRRTDRRAPASPTSVAGGRDQGPRVQPRRVTAGDQEGRRRRTARRPHLAADRDAPQSPTPSIQNDVHDATYPHMAFSLATDERSRCPTRRPRGVRGRHDAAFRRQHRQASRCSGAARGPRAPGRLPHVQSGRRPAGHGGTRLDRHPRRENPPISCAGCPARGASSSPSSRSAFALSLDGRTLAAGGRDGSVRFLEPASGEWRTALGRHAGRRTARRLQPDGRFLVTVGDDANAIVWDVAAGSAAETMEGHAGRVLALALDRRAHTLFTAGLDGSVIAWDLAGDRRLGRPFDAGTGTGGIPSTALSRDGRTLVTAQDDGAVSVIDTASLTRRRRTRRGQSVRGPRAGIRAARNDRRRRVLRLPGCRRRADGPTGRAPARPPRERGRVHADAPAPTDRSSRPLAPT